MAALWSQSHNLGIKQKAFSWRMDRHGNIFIKRKFRRGRFPKIDKISCSYLDKLCKFMQDIEWKGLSNDVSKLYTGTEKEGIGKFLYRLRPEIQYAQLSSHLGAIFYFSEVWKWNGQKRGMKFLLLSEDWQENTLIYYRNSLNAEKGGSFLDSFLENTEGKEQKQEAKEETTPEVKQTKLSAFFNI